MPRLFIFLSVFLGLSFSYASGRIEIVGTPAEELYDSLQEAFNVPCVTTSKRKCGINLKSLTCHDIPGAKSGCVGRILKVRSNGDLQEFEIYSGGVRSLRLMKSISTHNIPIYCEVGYCVSQFITVKCQKPHQLFSKDYHCEISS